MYNNLLGEFSQGTLWDSVFQGDKIQIQRIGLGWQKFPAIAPLESPITVFCFQMPHSWRSTNCTTILLFFCFVMKPTYLGTRGFHYLRNTGSPWGGLKINNNSKTIRISCTWGSKRKKKITLLPINTMRQKLLFFTLIFPCLRFVSSYNFILQAWMQLCWKVEKIVKELQERGKQWQYVLNFLYIFYCPINIIFLCMWIYILSQCNTILEVIN